MRITKKSILSVTFVKPEGKSWSVLLTGYYSDDVQTGKIEVACSFLSVANYAK